MLLDGWIHGTIMSASFNGVCTYLYSVLAGLGQGCVLSAILFLMFIRTITDQAPEMDPDYEFKWLIEKLHSQRLPTDAGVSTLNTTYATKIPVMVAADDTSLIANTRPDMQRLCEALFNWKEMCRYETNDSKFQLLVATAVPVRGLLGEYTVGRVVGANVMLPGRAVPIVAVPSATLLGCQLRTETTENTVWSFYVRKIVPHQLTIQRMLHLVDLRAAREYERAVILAPLMDAAAVDPDSLLDLSVFDRLQRKLWCGGGNSSALGIPCSASTIATHRIMGELQWSRVLQLNKVYMWRRMLHHTKVGSWPAEVAYANLQFAVEQLDAGLQITDPVMRSIHDIILKWADPLGLKCVIPSGRRVSVTVQNNVMEDLIMQDTVVSRGRPSLGLPWSGLSLPENSRAQGIADSWRRAEYVGRHLAASVSESNLMEAIWDCNDEYVASGVALQDSDVMQIDDNDFDTELAELRHEGRIADQWVLKLQQGAVAEQEIAWFREQRDYLPTDSRLGVGEAALVLLLHPAVDGRIGAHRWGLLHLMQMGHVKRDGNDTDVFLRHVAGCVPTTLSYICKMRGKIPWKEPAVHTDEERRLAVTCPCSVGIQDSLHFLVCQHRRMVQLRCDVVSVATNIVNQACALASSVDVGNDVPRRRGKRSRYDGSVMTPSEEIAHYSELNSWGATSEDRKLLLSLGLSDTCISTLVRTQLVSACLPLWATIQHLWDVVNAT
jgi:hypothetical protein